MKTMAKFSTTLTVLLFSVAMLPACGGGGGGGGESRVAYQGASTQATINSENAADLAALAYTGSELGDQSMLFSAVATGSGQAVDAQAPLIPKLTYMLLDLPGQLASNIGAPVNARTVVSLSESGTCTGGGSASISGSWDDVNGTLSATMTFNNCTEEGETTSGSMSISASGLIVGTEGDPVFDNASITVTLNNLTLISADENITVAGTTTMTIGGDSVSMDMTMAMRDNITGLSAKVENYTVSVVDMVDHSEVTISGTVYRSDVGFVTLSTPSTILVDAYTGEPYAGVYLIDGANGTWAEVDFGITVGDNGIYGDTTGTLGTFSI